MLEVRKLSKAYGKKRVLEEITFSLKPNEVTCLIGLNGAGKTTLMDTIMRLTPYQAGDILLDGQSLTVEDFDRLTYVPDKNIIPKSMTIQQALDFHGMYFAHFNEKRAAELLDFFKLKREDVVAKLSKGNRARANLLMALSLESDYLLLDEPFSGIDILTRERIASIFTTDLLENRGVLIATHEIQDIEHLVDKVILLDDGRIIREFYPEEVRLTEGKSIVDVLKEAHGHEEIY